MAGLTQPTSGFACRGEPFDDNLHVCDQSKAFCDEPPSSQQTTWSKMPPVFYRPQTYLHSFWLFQAIGCCCFGLASIFLVVPYVRRPWELGYSNSQSLFT